MLTSYLVSNAIVLPMTGWLTRLLRPQAVPDRLHRRCSRWPRRPAGRPPSLGFLILGPDRARGGRRGACSRLSQAILMESFPPQKRGVAMAAFGMGVVVAPIIGPMLGGWITDNYSWRWIFYINVPIGILAMLMSQAFVEDPPYLRAARDRPRRPHRLYRLRRDGHLAGHAADRSSTAASRTTGSTPRGSLGLADLVSFHDRVYRLGTAVQASAG